MKLLLGLIVTIAVVSKVINAWGSLGHETIGTLTDEVMDPNARQVVLQFFKDDRAGESFATASTWADQVDHTEEFRWSSELHYANTKRGECTFDYNRHCLDDRCVVGAIANYTSRLSDGSLPELERIEALKWLIHYVEDVHQPMHVSFSEDRGGNSIKGVFFEKHTNLHALWDDYILYHRLDTDFGAHGRGVNNAYVKYLAGLYRKTNLNQISACKVGEGDLTSCVSKWALESAKIACNYGYSSNGVDVEDGFELGQDYYNRGLPVLEAQLVKSTYRLSVLLDSIFRSNPDVFPLINGDELETNSVLRSNVILSVA